MTTFGAALTAAMDAADVSVKMLARSTGISDKTLYAYRSGGRNAPGRERLDAILAALHANAATRARLYAAAGITVSADPGALAADLVRGLPTARDRRLAVELLRTQARLAAQERGRDRGTAMNPEEAEKRSQMRAVLAEEEARQNGGADAETATPEPPAKPPRKGRR